MNPQPQTHQPPSDVSSPPQPQPQPQPQSQPQPQPQPQHREPENRDVLRHLEAYLAKRDGVDKVLKISRYAAKIIISSSLFPPSDPLALRLKAFESNLGLSRKAFRLGKFIQDVNALRQLSPNCTPHHSRFLLAVLCYGGEGIYYFIEQIVWLSKSGLIDARHSRNLQKISALAEFIGYIGSVSLKVQELRVLNEELSCLNSSVEIASLRGQDCDKESDLRSVLEEKSLTKKLSVVQDLADGLMALADIRDGGGVLSSPLLLSCAGLLSALISARKNWASC